VRESKLEESQVEVPKAIVTNPSQESIKISALEGSVHIGVDG